MAVTQLFGKSVASAGDFNGDGFDDIIIGAPDSRYNSRGFSGSAYLLFGQASGFQNLDLSNMTTADNRGFRIDGAMQDSGLGSTVAGAGDINQDGYDDIIVGTYSRSITERAYVIFGKGRGFLI